MSVAEELADPNIEAKDEFELEAMKLCTCRVCTGWMHPKPGNAYAPAKPCALALRVAAALRAKTLEPEST